MLKHNYIGTEHILLGLLREEEGLAARVLESLDITVERVRAPVVRIVGSGKEATAGQIPFTPRVKKVLELAVHEALSLGHNDIDPEHILLGVVRENEGIAARILLDFDADYETIRNEVIGMLSGPAARRERAARSGPADTRVRPDRDVSANCDEPALTDALTGLAKHRAWDEGLRREFARARRRGEPLCVALLDIHDLKRVSDQWGHPAGGEVLGQIARTCRTLLGAGDRAVHYGGDEFAITLPGMPAEVAFDVVERLRRALPAGLTCSAGLASSDGVRSASELVERADNALYEAKRIGGKLTLIAR